MKAVSLFGLVIMAFTVICGLGLGAEPHEIFSSAIGDVFGKTQIPILLPAWLPEEFRIVGIRAYGLVSENGYSFVLYDPKRPGDAGFAGQFSGETKVIDVMRAVRGARKVGLANGIVAVFRPLSCGGSCSPANLWWEEAGVMYNIQIRFSSSTDEIEQERVMLDITNSMVTVGRP